MELEQLMNVTRAFQESRAILTAVELDLFAAIQGGVTAEEAAGRVGTNPRATAMLLDALTACGLVRKESKKYFNTDLSAKHLTGAGRLATMHSVHLWDTWSTLTEAVRVGTSVARDGARGRDWTEAFIGAMHRIASERAPFVVQAVAADRAKRMLDVGGGSGAYSIAFAHSNAQLTADLLDLPEVTPIAQRHIAAAGLESRVRTRNGDLRTDDLGDGYDLILVSSICHMLSDDENRDLLKRCAKASARGGRIVIQEFVLNPQKTGPKAAALFALNMLVGTRAGAAYSQTEYEEWLMDAGFGDVQYVPLPGPSALMTGKRS